MREGGRIAADLKKLLVKKAQPGVKTKELDKTAEEFIKNRGATPSFKGYQGYPANIVTCVNEEVVHGIPGEKVLEPGDVLTVDVGVYYQGFNVDTAWSLLVGEEHFPKIEQFLSVGRKALHKAISACKEGNFVGDISSAIQCTIEDGGYNVIRAFTGHGVGENLHELPSIPCFGTPGEGRRLEKGMTLAIEVMYVMGNSEIEVLEDSWTTVTKDGSISAMFEESVAILGNKPQVLTAQSLLPKGISGIIKNRWRKRKR